MTKSWKKWLALLLRLGFGLLLSVASVNKIIHPFEFAEALDNYSVLGEGLSRWVAVWLPYLEAMTGLLLIIGIWLDAAVTINGLLMLIFLVLVSQAYGRGLDIRCGCYSLEGESTIGLMKVFENGLFMGCSILLAKLTWNKNPGSETSTCGPALHRMGRTQRLGF